jgi:serine/threonine-protein kinase
MVYDSKEVLGEEAQYTLLTLLARGGMAEVWLARQEGSQKMGKFVVVKKILPHLARDRDFREMFVDEARITSRFDHPNIVRIHETSLDGEDLFLVLEDLEGESLAFVVSAALERGKDMPPTLIAGAIAQVTDALNYAHNLRGDEGKPLGIVHRDISPQNIIVLYDGQVKLVDFGVAKAEKKVHQTQTGMMKGKVFYMSPEECLGEKVDARSDIFSLGIIFWEVLTCRHLFKRKLDIDTLRAIVSSRIPPVRAFNKDVTVALDAVVQRALEKEAADRYQTAADMGNAIREHLRRTKTMAGGREIRSFYMSVLADRMEEKRKLLKELEDADDIPAIVTALRPDTEKALKLSSVRSKDVMKQLGSEEDLDEPTEVSGLLGRPPGGYFAEPDEEEGDEPTMTTGVTAVEEPTRPAVDGEPEDTSEETHSAPPPLPEKEAPTGTMTKPGQAPEMDPLMRRVRPKPPPRLVPPTVEFTLPAVLGLILSFVFVTLLVKCPADDSIEPPAKASLEPVPFEEPKNGTLTVKPGGKPSQLAEAMLSIRSRPSGCRVRLNGVNLPGRTPIQNVSVEADQEYVVTVLCRKHKRASKSITPKSGDRVDLSFRPRRSRSATRYGLLELNTSPWTEVYLGRKKLGTTPILGYKLPAGKYKLRLINKKWAISKTLFVTINAGKTTKLVKNLDK